MQARYLEDEVASDSSEMFNELDLSSGEQGEVTIGILQITKNSPENG